MQVKRFFTQPGADPYGTLNFVARDSRIVKLDGSVVFEAKDVKVPDTWDQVSTDILAQKYFRRRGCNFDHKDSIYRSKVAQAIIPAGTDVPTRGFENDLREAIHRIVGCWTHWGEAYDYFATPEDAQAFYDELSYMMARQMFAPNSPQWFNTGLAYAYGIKGEAQGHYHVNPKTGAVTASQDAYSHPQTSACQPYNALISTPNGPMKIGDIVSKGLVGTGVYDSEGITEVLAVKSNGVKPVLRVVTKSGHTVEATADHRILVKDARGADRSPYWATVGSLRPGQILLYRSATTIEPKVVTPVQVAEAFLAGWLQGDGHVGIVNLERGHSTVIEAMAADEDEFSAVMDAIKLVFPTATPNIIEVETISPEITLRRIRFYGNDLCTPFIEKYGLLDRRLDMHVPQAVIDGGKQTVVAYLRALFQADGYVSTRVRDDLNTHVVGLATISKDLMEEVHTLLANLGIYSRLRMNEDKREDRHNLWSISIQVKSERIKFFETIGFVSTRKSTKLLETLDGAIPGRSVGETKSLQIERIEYLGEQEVYDIQTESENYLCGNIVVHNCFIQSIKDDLVGSGGIMDLWVREARLFKFGSGSGTNFSNLRGKNEKLSGGGVSSGLMSFLKVGDAAGGAIKSGGTSRRAAKMVILNADHPDVEDFITWKVVEEHKVAMLAAGSQTLAETWKAMVEAAITRDIPGIGTEIVADPKTNKDLAKVLRTAMKRHVPGPFLDQCLKRLEQGDVGLDIASYDVNWEAEGYNTVSSMNANNSIRVTDQFMEAVEEDREWHLLARTTGEIVKTIQARDLWKKIVHAAWMCADPGLQFHDTYNNWHTGVASGPILATNPCCFVGETLVDTSEGPIDFQNLCRISEDGEELPMAFSFDFTTGLPVLRQIKKAWVSGSTSTLIRVTTQRGHILTCTPEHRFYLHDGTPVRAMDLQEGMRLRIEEHKLSVNDRVAETQLIVMSEPVEVYDLEVEGTHNFGVMDPESRCLHSIIVHNSEYAYLDDTACNLASLKLTAFLKPDGDFDFDAFEHGCRLVTIALEITVAMSQYPYKDMAKNSYEHRTLGLGYADLGALLMHMGLPYDSDEGRVVGGGLASLMTGAAYNVSADLAGVQGPYPAYEVNKDHMMKVLANHAAASTGYGAGLKGLNPRVDTALLRTTRGGTQGYQSFVTTMLQHTTATWTSTLDKARFHGIRNAQVTVLAPTGTIGLLMGCDTTGVEPDFALVKFKKLAGGGYFKIVNSGVSRALHNLGYTEAEIEEITEYAVGCPFEAGLVGSVRWAQLVAEFGQEALELWAKALPGAFDPAMVLPIPRLIALFGEETVNKMLQLVSGTGTVEGAVALQPEHYAIFDCANKCGRIGTRFIAPNGHLMMMAAIQPFISGSISKTVNLPATATLDDVSTTYMNAWKWGVKSIALYRDGSKMSQALATNMDLLHGVDLLMDEEAPIQTKVEAVAQALVKKAIRHKLPGRRTGYTQAARIGETKIYLRTGEYEDGTLGEIFLDTHKEGTAMRALLNSFAICISIGLQHGIPLEEYCDAYLFTKFEPHGGVQGHDAIKRCTSILDYIFRDLAISYLGRHELAHIDPADLINESGPSKPMGRSMSRGMSFGLVVEESEEGIDTEAPISVMPPVPPPAYDPKPINPQAQAKLFGFTGDCCPSCGHFTMVRNGTCLKCNTCGGTTGCS